MRCASGSLQQPSEWPFLSREPRLEPIEDSKRWHTQSTKQTPLRRTKSATRDANRRKSVRVREQRSRPSCNCIHLYTRLLNCGGRFQACDHRHEAANVFSVIKRLRNNPRRPHLRLGARKRAVFNKPVEAFRGNADDNQGMPV